MRATDSVLIGKAYAVRHIGREFDDVVYAPDLLAEHCFTEEYLMDRADVENSDNVTYEERRLFRRSFLSSLGSEDLDTSSMLDPYVLEFTLGASDKPKSR